MPPFGTVLRLLGSLCAVFILSQFYRTAVAVIAPELRRDPGLTAEQLGILTGTFFVAIAAMQIPVGVLLDRFGPRRVVPSLLVLAVVGAWVFASVESLVWLIVGQALIGAGCAGIFMGGLVTIARWFPPERFATISAVALGISGLGMLLSGTPFAAFADAIGWRDAYLVLGGITAVLGAVVWLAVRDAPEGHSFHRREPEPIGSVVRGVGQVLADRRIWGILAVSFVGYATMISIRGLWGGPYLADVYGLGAVATGDVLLIMSAAGIVGIFAYGPMDRVFRTRKGVVLTGGLLTMSVAVVLAAVPGNPLWLTTVLFSALAGFNAYFVHLLAHGRAFFPEHLVGRVMTTINFANFCGVGAIQVASGYIVGGFAAPDGTAPEAAYRWVFAFLAAMLALALTAYLTSPDVRPGRDAAE